VVLILTPRRAFDKTLRQEINVIMVFVRVDRDARVDDEQWYTVIEWTDGVVRMLDQRLLPHKVSYMETRSYHKVAEAIRNMTIRGAPSIGVAAAYGIGAGGRAQPGCRWYGPARQSGTGR